MPSSTLEISKTPIRTTLAGLVAILVPVMLVAFTYGVLQNNSDRDHQQYERDLVEFRKDLDEQQTMNTATATQQAQNTVDLNVVINQVSNNNDTMNRLMGIVNTLLEDR